MSGYVVVCSQPWEFLGNPGTQVPGCTGTLSNVPYTELNPSGLSAEDLSDYIGHVLILFAVVFGCLAIKKAIS